MASPILRGGNLIVTEQGIRDGVRQVPLPLWNTYGFLALYAPKVGTWRVDSVHVLDRYILAKLAYFARRPPASRWKFTIFPVPVNICVQFTEALTSGMCDRVAFAGSGQKTPMPSTRYTPCWR